MLVHGWGHDASVWDGVCREIADLPIVRVDLGFFGTPASLPALPQDTPVLGVGHSLGFLWLLRHAPRCKALLSVGGFARFTQDRDYPGVPPAALAHIRRGFERDPAQALAAFWQACGAAPEVAVQKANLTALLEGLDWLRDWDERAALAAVSRVHALASVSDVIVPPDMSKAAFAGHAIEWVEGGHALPLLESRRIAVAIRHIYRNLA